MWPRPGIALEEDVNCQRARGPRLRLRCQGITNSSTLRYLRHPLPARQVIARTIAAMREGGVKVVFGRWLIEGHPMVVLFDVEAAAHRAGEWKKVGSRSVRSATQSPITPPACRKHLLHLSFRPSHHCPCPRHTFSRRRLAAS